MTSRSKVIERLAFVHLRDERIALWPERAAIDRAAAYLGLGADHLVGERVLALLDDTVTGGGFRLGALVTDERLLATSEGRSTAIPYAEMTSVEGNTALFSGGVRIRTATGELALPLVTVKPLAQFLSAVLAEPAEERKTAPQALVVPTSLDATGLAGARAALQSKDPRATILVDLAREGRARSWFNTDLARDFAARAVLFDRTLQMGRGWHDDAWLTAVGGPDLAQVLTHLLGPPARMSEQGADRTFDFPLAGPGAAGPVRAAWTTPTLDTLRARLTPRAGHTTFALTSIAGEPLSTRAPELLALLFDALPAIEGRVLLIRTLYGWGLGPHELGAADPHPRAREALGHVDLAPFFA